MKHKKTKIKLIIDSKTSCYFEDNFMQKQIEGICEKLQNQFPLHCGHSENNEIIIFWDSWRFLTRTGSGNLTAWEVGHNPMGELVCLKIHDTEKENKMIEKFASICKIEVGEVYLAN